MARLDSKEQLVKIWKRWASVVGEKSSADIWGDKRNEVRNCVIDAELLLCLLTPQTELRAFNIVSMTDDVRNALSNIGAQSNSDKISQNMSTRIANILLDYFDTYSMEATSTETKPSQTDKLKKNRFDSSSYIDLVADDLSAVANGGAISQIKGTLDSKEVGKLETVDAFSYSAMVAIHALLLKKKIDEDELARRSKMTSPEWKKVGELAAERLSLSMTGLLASFALITDKNLNTGDWQDNTNRTWPERFTKNPRLYKTELSQIRNALSMLGYDERLPENECFEIGFSWGPISPEKLIFNESDPTFEKVKSFSKQQAYHAESAPYFYFTVNALDAIAVINSELVSTSDVLGQEHLALAAKLRNLADLTRRYWNIIALAQEGEGLWAVEQVPWRPADGPEYASEYWNLYIIRLIYQSIPAGKQNIERALNLLSELARRGRIIQDAYPADSDITVDRLHHTGFPLALKLHEEKKEGGNKEEGDTGTILAFCRMLDFAPQLLKACGNLLSLTRDPDQREQISRLIGGVWEHLNKRKDIDDRTLASWDCLGTGVYTEYTFRDPKPVRGDDQRVSSWYLTERVAEALVAVSLGNMVRPETPKDLSAMTLELLTEIEWQIQDSDAFSRLRDDDRLGYKRNLDQAREKIDTQPAIAFALAVKVAQKFADLTTGEK